MRATWGPPLLTTASQPCGRNHALSLAAFFLLCSCFRLTLWRMGLRTVKPLPSQGCQSLPEGRLMSTGMSAGGLVASSEDRKWLVRCGLSSEEGGQ